MSCEVWDDMLRWEREVCMPKLTEYARHVAQCPECRESMLSQRDALALGILQMTDEQVLENLSHFRSDPPPSSPGPGSFPDLPQGP